MSWPIPTRPDAADTKQVQAVRREARREAGHHKQRRDQLSGVQGAGGGGEEREGGEGGGGGGGGGREEGELGVLRRLLRGTDQEALLRGAKKQGEEELSSCVQSWALAVSLNFFNDKNDIYFTFLSS